MADIVPTQSAARGILDIPGLKQVGLLAGVVGVVGLVGVVFWAWRSTGLASHTTVRARRWFLNMEKPWQLSGHLTSASHKDS